MDKRLWILLALPLAGCAPPEDALGWSCKPATITSLSTECQVEAAKLPALRYAYVRADTKNFKVRVSATFSVVKGRVAVTFPDCAEGGSAEVTVERPASVQCDAAVNRSTFTVTIEARPGEGGAEGLAGTLTIKPI
jgi:hypothetical protein